MPGGLSCLFDSRNALCRSLQTSKSALHEAALCGHADVVAEMLRKGADHELALSVSILWTAPCTECGCGG